MRLAGQRALVTGAGSQGIGRAIALALAREGAAIAAHWHRKEAVAEALAAEIRALGRSCVMLQADLAAPAAARALVGDAVAALGGLDIMVANASMIVRKPFLDLTDDDMAAMTAVNLAAYFACGQAAARAMVAQGRGGRIIMVSSTNQQLAVKSQSAYSATKGGVMQLAKGMALELAPHAITVNLIAPGATLTDLNRHLFADDAFRRSREAAIPLGRLGTPEDVGAAAVYFASAEAAYVTGATLVIDGGLSLP